MNQKFSNNTPERWKSLKCWGKDISRVEPLTGGVANDVWRVSINGYTAVARLGSRNDADLEWETDLLHYLNTKGFIVPEPIPTIDGKLFANGIVVMSYVEGVAPKTENDWHRVVDTLRQIHQLTQNWPQRPGWQSSIDLLQATTGTKVDLNKMPPEGVARCRAAWARLATHQTCVIHGDSNNLGNIRINNDQVGLIDWDESHVDVPELDLVLPYNAADFSDDMHNIAAQASAAWEAAVCWDDEFSMKRLAEVRPI